MPVRLPLTALPLPPPPPPHRSYSFSSSSSSTSVRIRVRNWLLAGTAAVGAVYAVSEYLSVFPSEAKSHLRRGLFHSKYAPIKNLPLALANFRAALGELQSRERAESEPEVIGVRYLIAETAENLQLWSDAANEYSIIFEQLAGRLDRESRRKGVELASRIGGIYLDNLHDITTSEKFLSFAAKSALGWIPDQCSTTSDLLSCPGTFPTNLDSAPSIVDELTTATILANLGALYQSSHRPDLALAIYTKSLTFLSTTTTNPCQSVTLHNNIADCYTHLSPPDYPSARNYLLVSKQLADSTCPELSPTVIHNLASISESMFLKTKNPDYRNQATELYQSLLQSSENSVSELAKEGLIRLTKIK